MVSTGNFLSDGKDNCSEGFGCLGGERWEQAESCWVLLLFSSFISSVRWQPENAKIFVCGDGYPGECVFKVCFLACPGISALAWLCNSSSLSGFEVLKGVGSLQEKDISGAFKLLCEL